MSTGASSFWKTYFSDSKKSEIKYTYAYEYFKGTVKISEENILYFELYKKDNFLTKVWVFYPYTQLQISYFCCNSKYNTVSTKTFACMQGNVYVFMWTIPRQPSWTRTLFLPFPWPRHCRPLVIWIRLLGSMALVPLGYIWIKANRNKGPRLEPIYVVFE
jgi:hypothetical protein